MQTTVTSYTQAQIDALITAAVSNAEAAAATAAATTANAAVATQATSDAATYVAFKQAAKNPDLLIVGAVTRNANGVITTAAVVWPDGSPGTFTTDTIDASNAINGYHITYGSPATKTYTQPTITRDASGNATNVPQITVA